MYKIIVSILLLATRVFKWNITVSLFLTGPGFFNAIENAIYSSSLAKDLHFLVFQ